MWQCKKCKREFFNKDIQFCSTCEKPYPQLERVPLIIPVTAKIERWYERHAFGFKGRGGLKGHRNHINRDRMVKTQRSPIQHRTDMLAAMFRQIFGYRVRSANNKSVKSV
jgi:hypothetical protein